MSISLDFVSNVSGIRTRDVRGVTQTWQKSLAAKYADEA